MQSVSFGDILTALSFAGNVGVLALTLYIHKEIAELKLWMYDHFEEKKQPRIVQIKHART